MSYVLTLIADRRATSLTPGLISAARDAAGGGSEPRVLSDGEAVDILVEAAPDLGAVRAALGSASVDALASKPRGRRRGLLIADMDSTIVTTETLDELAGEAGKGAEIAAITSRSMNGELDFAEALRERVAMLKGLEVAALDRTWARTALTPGATSLVATMRSNGAMAVLVSGGFTAFTSRVAAQCGFDAHRANTLEEASGRLTGAVTEPILDRDAKLSALREFAALRGVRMAATCAIGDGANDLAMLREAGLGIAYHPRPVVAREIANRIEHADLRAVLFAQGYAARGFVSGS